MLSPATLPRHVNAATYFREAGVANEYQAAGSSALRLTPAEAAYAEATATDPLSMQELAADAVRIFTRNIGLLFTATKGTHEGTGRYAENVISWMAGRAPPAPRYHPALASQWAQGQAAQAAAASGATRGEARSGGGSEWGRVGGGGNPVASGRF